VGRPQSIPVTRVSTVNTTPTSAEAAASTSQAWVRFHSHMALPTPRRITAPYMAMATGTWR
jgi:hypothetical protein